MNRIIALLACLVVLSSASTVLAQPTAQFWEEVGGSASGDGLSAATRGVPTGNRQVSVAVGPDGRPVVAYADGDTILVRRWTGAAWELIGPSSASGGLPQIVTDAAGRMYLAWRQFVPPTESFEIFLLARDWTGTTWQPLGTSGSGGGISGAEGGAGVPAYSLALGPDGTPYIAYQSTTFTEADFTTQTAGLHAWTNQIFVRRWSGSAWVFLGSGREGGGASNALSFKIEGHGTTTFVSHNAEHPTLAIGADGKPVVAFIYSSMFEGGNPPEFNGENDDMYAVRWNGTAWEPLGPALPTTLDNVALGAPGGISNTPGWIREVGHDRLVRPSIMVDRDGTPVLAWGETNFDDGFRYIYVYKFNGTSWQGLGSPSGQIDKIAFAYDTSLAQGVEGPIVAWPRGGGDQSWIAVMEYSPSEGRWRTLGDGSVSPGISVPGDRAFNPRVVVTSAGVPTVVWIDLTPTVPQAFLRTYSAQTLPDLSISSVTAPASAQPGQSFGVTAIVRNGGNAAAAGSSLNFYLAAGTERAAGDVLLGSRSVPTLAVGGSATLDLTITVPAGTASGSWRILAVVDEDAAVAELNENNNTQASSPFTVGSAAAPDLDITALTTPATVQAGGTLAVQHTIANIGTAASGPFTLSFFLSADGTLDAGDRALGTRALGSLGAGVSSTLTTTLTVPDTTTAPAAYHVIAMATLDAGTDRDPSNNGAVSATINVTPRDVPSAPDLTVTNVSVPSTIVAGRPLAVTHTVSNVGTAAAGGFTVRFYLSSDAALDGGDRLLGSRTLTGLAAGATNTTVSTVTLPAGVPAATYRVLVVADALAEVTERDETNNVGVSGALAVSALLPDLTVASVTMPATGALGRPLAITSTVRNAGPAPAGAFTVRFYLSGTPTLDASRVLLGARAIGGLGVGASSMATSVLTIPATTAPADYYVIAVADALEQQVETDESNNMRASTTTVAVSLYRPDLTLTTLTTPPTGQMGRPLAITNTVRNAGPAPAGAFTVRFYLSSDAALDGGDVLLGTRMIGGLGVGATSTAITSLTIPATTPPAIYQVIAVVDAAEQQAETNEGNNTAVSAPLSITLYRPDLSMTAMELPPSGAVGRPFLARFTIRNAGPAPAGVFTVKFYLSTDTVLDGADILLATRNGGGLGAGASRTEAVNLNLPADLAPGMYFVIAVTDALDQYAEMDETNNIKVSDAMPVVAYRPDLRMSRVTIPATGAIGRPLAITSIVRNAGPAPAGPSTVRFYLSSDGQLDAGDVLLGTRTVGGLAAGAMNSAVTSLVIPADTVPGPYRVIAVADALEQQVELDELNNALASDTTVTLSPYRPDLMVSVLTVPARGIAGRTLSITSAVRNVGPAPAGPSTVRFFLSTNGTLDGAVLLGIRGIPALGAGASSATAVTVVTIPSSTPVPGSYEVIAVADALNQQDELDETNNVTTTTAPMSITSFRPDLTLTAVSATAAAAGRPLSVTTTTRNAGTAPADRAFTVAFYLSADDTLDAGDVALGGRTIFTGIAAGASRTDRTTVVVPGDVVVPTDYRVIAVVGAVAQTELDVSNNAAVFVSHS